MPDVTQKTISTKIPARLDRLPWSRWHWYIVLALGTVWVLDGLEVTMKGTVGPTLRDQLGMSSGQVGAAASLYVAGAVSGALVWGYLTDRVGRRKLFMVTLAVYLAGVVLTTFSWNFGSFVSFRVLTGFGIGGEYSAINSAVDELIPARARGRVDLIINGTYWFGAAIAAALGLAYLHLLPPDYGWRAGFATGAVLAVGILLLRRSVPESPRWLMTHGHEDEAERITREIEESVESDTGAELDEPPDSSAIELRERRSIGFLELARTLFKVYPRRSAVGFALMATQAFTYNAIFFTYGLILTTFYGVSTANVGWFMLPFAAGNFFGPLVLGRFFDTIGRRPMIAMSYSLAGALTIALGFAFTRDWLGSTGMTIGWVVVFFFASAGASAGYLTVSETFPLEIRAMAIAFFYAIATAAGGIVGPWLFGALIGDGSSRDAVFLGYAIGGGLMVVGAAFELVWGVAAEQKSLEDIAAPLSATEHVEEGEDRPVHTGPAGVDVADAGSVTQFQQEHGLEGDGLIGAATRGALQAARHSAEGDGADELVDVTDAGAVRAFQREHGLAEDGVVGPQTRGALAFLRRALVIDLTDPDQVRAFQREHGLASTGVIDRRTQVTLRTERVAAAEREGAHGELPVDVDPADPDTIRRFQEAVGIEADGIIGPTTRGALLAARRLRWTTAGVDLTDPDAVRSFQHECGLPDDGVVGPATMRAVREARDGLDGRGGVHRMALDPADEESIRSFQQLHGLEVTGAVDVPTQQALRFEADHNLGVDPSDEASVRRFQRDHGLHVDGILGHETQGAIRSERSEQEAGDDDERERRYGAFAADSEAATYGVDPADAASIAAFQRHYGLDPDGVIGPETRTALQALQAGDQRPKPGGASPPRRYARRAMVSGLWSGAITPAVDTALDGEIESLEHALLQGAPVSRTELAHRVGARTWEPGRFGRALAVATREGRVRRRTGGRYELGGSDRPLVSPGR
jgi:MFS family permease/peptidoglycan hydrolase-like protein with peptidoglycan-binding domain